MIPTDEQLKARWKTEDGQKRLAAIKKALVAGQKWDAILVGFPYTDESHQQDLRGVDFSRSNLANVNLSDANLAGANLVDSYLPEIKLTDANLTGARLDFSNLAGSRLMGANLSKASLHRTILIDADLRHATLTGANLMSIDLSKHDLWGVKLSNAVLSNANLSESNLTMANLEHANLSGANLKGCILVRSNLKGADISGATVFGVSVWQTELDDQTKQDNLVITDEYESQITVDDIRVAQFIYLLLNNPNIRDVIDTIAKKVVLILGRFIPERMAVLEALRSELRTRGYCPVLFDFEKPANRDITETVSTLAHMARFVIADITDAKSIPQELMAIVPNLPSVAVQPLILTGQREYGMFEHFKKYPWVLPLHEYDDQIALIADIGRTIIVPAEAKVLELLQPRP